MATSHILLGDAVSGNPGGKAFSVSTTYYLVPSTGDIALNTVSGSGSVRMRTPGTISNLRVQLAGGNRTGSSPGIFLRVNGNDVNSQVLFAPGGVAVSTPGEFVDSTHTDTVNSGDFVTIRGSGGSGGNANYSLTAISFDFVPTTSGTVTRLSATGQKAVTASTTSFAVPGSDLTTSTTQAEGEIQINYPTGVSGLIARNLWVYASTDTGFSVDNTVSLNGATGAGTAPNVAFHNGGATWHEDTTNQIMIKNGDKLSFKIICAATGSLTLENIGIELYDSYQGLWWLVIGSAAGVALSRTNFMTIGGGGLGNNATETRAQNTLGISNVVFSNLAAYTKTAGTTSGIGLRANAANAGSPAQIKVTTTSSGAWNADNTNRYASRSTDAMSHTLVFGSANATVTAVIMACRSAADKTINATVTSTV